MSRIRVEIGFKEGLEISSNGDLKILVHNSKNWETEEIDLTKGLTWKSKENYLIPWSISFSSNDSSQENISFDPRGKNIHILLDSLGLGDVISWVPQIERFRKISGCNIIITTFFNELFSDSYPHFLWLNPNLDQYPAYAVYRIGYFLDDDKRKRTPFDPRDFPLGKIPCDILGIPYIEERPKIFPLNNFNPPIKGEKYVCISTESPVNAKKWNRIGGWEEIVKFLHFSGYKVVNIQKEPNEIRGVIDLTGDIPLRERAEILRGSDFFVGLSSGLSWLSWAVHKPVVLISGFTEDYNEFNLDCYKVKNKSVCNSCWNDKSYEFDKTSGWCPRHKNSEREFECTKMISPEMVIEKIQSLMRDKKLIN